MKKLIYLFAIIAIGFTSCGGGGNAIVGTWQLDSVSGEELTASEKEATFTMNEDGSYEQKRGDRVIKGKWEVSEDGKTLTTTDEEGDVKTYADFECAGDVLSFSERDDKITFKKVK